MRNFIKIFKTSTYKVLVYNKATKKEEEHTLVKPELGHALEMPKDCIELSKELVGETEEKRKMTPLEFFTHSTVVE